MVTQADLILGMADRLAELANRYTFLRVNKFSLLPRQQGETPVGVLSSMLERFRGAASHDRTAWLSICSISPTPGANRLRDDAGRRILEAMKEHPYELSRHYYR
jgi:hypothetical protein